MKTKKIIYWIITGSFLALQTFQSFIFIFNSQQIAKLFEKLHVTPMIIIPLGIAKILGIIAIVSRKNRMLKDFAYYGFLIDFTSAITAHLIAQDGQFIGAAVTLILCVFSLILERQVFKP